MVEFARIRETNGVKPLPNVPLGADKTHDASDGIFTNLSNDKYNKYSTVGNVFEFASNRQQPQVCSFIRLEVMLI